MPRGPVRPAARGRTHKGPGKKVPESAKNFPIPGLDPPGVQVEYALDQLSVGGRDRFVRFPPFRHPRPPYVSPERRTGHTCAASGD